MTKRKGKSNVALFVVFLLFGLFSAGIGGYFLYHNWASSHTGVNVEATLVEWELKQDTEERNGRTYNETSYFPVFEFEWEGETVRHTSNQGVDYAGSQKYSVGQTMTVRYVDDPPYLTYTGTTGSSVVSGMFVGLGILLLTLAFPLGFPKHKGEAFRVIGGSEMTISVNTAHPDAILRIRQGENEWEVPVTSNEFTYTPHDLEPGKAYYEIVDKNGREVDSYTVEFSGGSYTDEINKLLNQNE